MTKAEAIQAMMSGQKVTHTNFCNGEWMTMQGASILFEDGVIGSFSEFWHYRKDASWETGYSIWQGGGV
nr:MAG TPA: hypothetical protein [Caudoviricetes sp.]